MWMRAGANRPIAMIHQRLAATVAAEESTTAMNDIALSDNPAAHRFELRRGGLVLAHSEYNLLKDSVMFTHTEVLPQHEREGLGSTLVKFSLDDVRRRGLHVIPVCPFVAAYIRQHREYLDLVTEQNRRAFIR